MARYVCSVCGYVYDEEIGDPENGIPAGTVWEDVYEDYVCPLCGASKDMFDKEQLKWAGDTPPVKYFSE